MCTNLYWIDLRFLVSVYRETVLISTRQTVLCTCNRIIHEYLNKYMYKIMMQACTMQVDNFRLLITGYFILSSNLIMFTEYWCHVTSNTQRLPTSKSCDSLY